MRNIVEHDEFISCRRAGRVDVEIDRSKALEIANAKTTLPARYQREYMWWTVAWLSTLPAAAVAAFFVKWWIGLLVLLFLTPALFRTANRRVMQFIIDYAVENAAFYAYAVENNVIRVRTKP
jgi:hypothetical protein